MYAKTAMVALLIIGLAAPMSGCLRVRTEHKVEPIEINVNVRLQMEREMTSFFDELYEESDTAPVQ